MKKIYESNINSWNEVGEVIYVYELENNEEYWKFDEMTHKERCERMGVFDESGYEVAPGSIYHTYHFDLHGYFIVMVETIALNV